MNKLNHKAHKLIIEYFNLNNRYPDDKNHESNYCDIKGYQETLDESPLEDAFDIEDIEHIKTRIEYLRMYHEAKEGLKKFSHIYT